MQCRIITRFDQLERLTSEWNRLWSGNPCRQIFGRFEWCRAWWRAYGANVALCTPAAFEQDKLVALLPLVRQRGRLTFLGEPGSDYNDILCESRDPGILQRLLEALCGYSRAVWKSAILGNVPEQSVLFALLQELPQQWRSRFVTTEGHLCPSVILNGENTEGTLRDILAQKEPRQHERKLQKLGKLTFRHIEDRSEILRHLPTYFEQHTQRWALVVGGNQKFLDDQSRIFYAALSEQFDPRNELRFSVMELDGKPIAYHFGFQLDGKFILYKTTFDINLWDESPGQVLIRQLFLYAQSARVREFDFTIGNEAYKNRIANHTNRNFTLRLFRPGLAGLAERKFFVSLQGPDQEHRATHEFLKNVRAMLISASGRLRESRLFGKSPLAAARKFLFARRELLVFSLEQGLSRLCSSWKSRLNVKLQVATLGDLANFSPTEPELLDRSKLQCARMRLRKGDIAYIAQIERKMRCLIWVGTRDVLGPSESELVSCIPLEKPAAVIYDLWIAPQLRNEIAASVLHVLTQSLREKGLPVWIFCNGSDVVLRRAIETCGFVLRYRLKHRWLLGSHRHRSETVISKFTPQTTPNVRSDLGLLQS